MLVNINKNLIKCLKLESHQHPMNLGTVKTESHVIFWKSLTKLLRGFKWREKQRILSYQPLLGLSHGVIQTVDLAGPVLIGQVFKKDRYYNVRERETVNSYGEWEIKLVLWFSQGKPLHQINIFYDLGKTIFKFILGLESLSVMSFDFIFFLK